MIYERRYGLHKDVFILSKRFDDQRLRQWKRRGQLRIPYNTIPLTKALIVETFGKNKNIFVITKNAPYAWGNFRACAITRFQKPQQLSWAGRDQRARCSSMNTCAVGPRPELTSQRCCKLWLKQGSKNRFSNTRQGGSKQEVLVAKMAAKLKF